MFGMQNPVSGALGSFTCEGIKYFTFAKVLETLGVTGKIAPEIKKLPFMNEIRARHVANYISDTIADITLDTVPTMITEAKKEGSDAGDVAKAGAQNLATNAAWNLFFDAFFTALKANPIDNAVKNVEDSAKHVDDAAKSVDDVMNKKTILILSQKPLIRIDIRGVQKYNNDRSIIGEE